jgi:hypothetical protein
MTETLTEKQRVTVEGLEGAGPGRRAAERLRERTRLGPVYDAIAALRRLGALPRPDRPRKRPRESRFVAVRVASSPAPATEIARARSGVVCRLECAQGWAIECGEWPEPSWVSAVFSGREDAAS